MTHTSDPTANLADGAFAHLSDRDKARVLFLLARVSESAYRRGAQHGANLMATRPSDLPLCLGSWRYGSSLASSPWLDTRGRATSLHRLEVEIGHALCRIGLTTKTGEES